MELSAPKVLPTSLINKLISVKGGKILIVPVNSDGTVELPETSNVTNLIVKNGMLIYILNYLIMC